MRIDRKKLAAKLSAWPSGAAAKLEANMTSSDFDGVISAADAAAMAAETGTTVSDLALKLVPYARLYAVAPVSNVPLTICSGPGSARAGALISAAVTMAVSDAQASFFFK